MNEGQWLAAISPRGGLDYLCGPEVAAHRRKAGRRKLRLFLCSCVRRVWGLIPRGPLCEAVELGERLCEGEDVAARIDALGDLEVEGPLVGRHAGLAAKACVATSLWHAAVTGSEAAARAAGWARLQAEGGQNMQTRDQGEATEHRAQAELLREIVGNPFRLVRPDPAWLRWNHRTLPAMAEAIYTARTFQQLPLLADALEEAGCTDAELLNHCRRTEGHVRGCWVIDLLLGKG
jgi:hypothetical protein